MDEEELNALVDSFVLRDKERYMQKLGREKYFRKWKREIRTKAFSRMYDFFRQEQIEFHTEEVLRRMSRIYHSWDEEYREKHTDSRVPMILERLLSEERAYYVQRYKNLPVEDKDGKRGYIRKKAFDKISSYLEEKRIFFKDLDLLQIIKNFYQRLEEKDE